MSVSAYILIQTEVGRLRPSSRRAEACRRRAGRRRHRPVRRDPAHRGSSIDELGRMVVSQVQLVDGITAHADLPRRPPLSIDAGGVSAGGRSGTAALLTFDRQVDEAVEQFGIRHAGDVPQPRVHRDVRREARNRVQLVDDERAVVAQEEVDARHRFAAARLERTHRECAHLFGLRRAQFGAARCSCALPSSYLSA